MQCNAKHQAQPELILHKFIPVDAGCHVGVHMCLVLLQAATRSEVLQPSQAVDSSPALLPGPLVNNTTAAALPAALPLPVTAISAAQAPGILSAPLPSSSIAAPVPTAAGAAAMSSSCCVLPAHTPPPPAAGQISWPAGFTPLPAASISTADPFPQQQQQQQDSGCRAEQDSQDENGRAQNPASP